MTTAQTSSIEAKVRHVVTQFQFSMIILTLMGVCPVYAVAQAGHSNTLAAEERAPDQNSQANALLRIVRESTERF